MIAKLVRLPVLMAGIPGLTTDRENFDIVDPKFKTGRQPGGDSEDGWERVKRIFRNDDFGRMSPELNAMYQAGFLGAFVGSVYGGFLGSRKAYFDFLDRNQATAFESHLDAKRKLQDAVTVNFAKNAFRFGWRLALFTTSYTAMTTIISVYRGKSSMVEYLTAGAATGAMYKFNMGLKGMAAGGIVGGTFGGFAGVASLLLLNASGMTMEDMRYWQYKWRQQQDDAMEDIKVQAIKGTEHDDENVTAHDVKVGTRNLDLNALELDTQKHKILQAAKRENEAIMKAATKETPPPASSPK